MSRARQTSRIETPVTSGTNKPSPMDSLTPVERQLIANHRAKSATFAIIEGVKDNQRRTISRHTTTYAAIVITIIIVLFLGTDKLFLPLFDGLQLNDILTPLGILCAIWLASLIGLIRVPSVKEY